MRTKEYKYTKLHLVKQLVPKQQGQKCVCISIKLHITYTNVCIGQSYLTRRMLYTK